MAVDVLETRLDGPILLVPEAHGDERGFFQETYVRAPYRALGIFDEFVQDNHSRSRRGVVRGMHFQIGAGQAKLVRCARGAILDVVVDLRRESRTFGQWESFALDDRNLRQLYCPVGFAHGFCATTDAADVLYKVSAYFDPGLERGIAYDDPQVAIEWPDLELVASERDRRAPRLADIMEELPFR